MFSELAVGRILDLLPYTSELDDKTLAFAQQLKGKRQESFLASRILLWRLLKKIYPDLTELPSVQLMQYGKPYFPEFRCFFNLTHSAKATIAYVSDEGPCAVDLEFLKQRYNFEGLKNKVLGRGEWPFFERSSVAEQLELFTALWTVRECVLKLSGRGLGGLGSIAIDLDAGSIQCPDNQRAVIHCARFDDYLEGIPTFCSYSEHLTANALSQEEILVGQQSALSYKSSVALGAISKEIIFWQFKESELRSFTPSQETIKLRLN